MANIMQIKRYVSMHDDEERFPVRVHAEQLLGDNTCEAKHFSLDIYK